MNRYGDHCLLGYKLNGMETFSINLDEDADFFAGTPKKQ